MESSTEPTGAQQGVWECGAGWALGSGLLECSPPQQQESPGPERYVGEAFNVA